jgi:hypothetical protein
MSVIQTIISVIITILLVPLQLVIVPIDLLLSQIPGINIIPETIASVASFVGSIPQTIVSLLGISPVLWNALFLLFIAFITIAPTIQMVKKVVAWARG